MINFLKLLHQALPFSVMVFLLLTASGCNADEQWTDEVLLHDGKSIEVKRSVDFHFGQGELSAMFTRYPDQYSLKIKDPSSGKTVNWESPRGFNQIALDFWNNVPYGVISQNSVFANLKQYGCPIIPLCIFSL